MKRFLTVLIYLAIIGLMAYVVLFRLMRGCRRFAF